MPLPRPQALLGRSRVVRALRSFFDGRGFLEVETPALVTSPGLDLHLDAFEVPGPSGPRYLHTSPEYCMKRLVAEGIPAIYQVCKAYRQDEAGPWHNPEFTMVEWYQAGQDMDGLITATESLVAAVCMAIHGGTTVPAVPPFPALDLSPPWPRLSVREAFERYSGLVMDEVAPDEDRFFRVLLDEIEPRLPVERPTVLYGYPAAMASLARLCPGDPSVADRFEVYIRGVELCNGFAELTNPQEQRRRLQLDQAQRRAMNKPVYPLDERFLAALESGLPDCAGNALGVDRLAMILLGAGSVAEVMAFTSDLA